MRTDVAERVELAVGDGTRMFAEVVRAAGPAAGGIIVFQDAYGVNEQLREMAARFATIGYTAIAPELFHRTGTGIVAAYNDNRNPLRMQAKDDLCDDGIVADARSAYEWLAGQAGIPQGSIAAVGFCMGGRVSYLANAHLPLRAAISFYGGGIAPDLLSLASLQHGELLMFWGGQDAHIGADQRRAVADALTQAGKRHEQVVFSHAKHGFFGHRHPDYDVPAASRSWSTLVAFLTPEQGN
jgi:carboxymethylenebutenolidase